ncbi:SDR family oxidoreductase [Rugamonas sp. CCM 8940]|nr:SDR family oxidoreductase [Rugamonas sp. CCM 8940]
MQYFVTGAIGFIGKRLVKKLLARKGSVVYFLTRESSREKIPAPLDFWGVSKTRAIPVFGDLRSRKPASTTATAPSPSSRCASAPGSACAAKCCTRYCHEWRRSSSTPRCTCSPTRTRRKAAARRHRRWARSRSPCSNSCAASTSDRAARL